MVSRRRRLSLIASRKRRLIRFRSLAFPSCREIKTPHLNWSAGCQIRVKKSVGNLCPCANSSSISARRFRLTERGSLFFPTNLCRQPFAPLGAPAGQHSAAGLGCHAGAETVIVQLFTVRRLKRSFHYMPASRLALEYSKKVVFVKVIMVLERGSGIRLKRGRIKAGRGDRAPQIIWWSNGVNSVSRVAAKSAQVRKVEARRIFAPAMFSRRVGFSMN